ARRADRLPRPRDCVAGEADAAGSATRSWHDYPLHLAQHGRGRAVVQPNRVPESRSHHRDRQPDRNHPRDPQGGACRTGAGRGVPARGARGPTMKPHRIMAVIVRHTYEARRNVDRITDMVYWPVLDIIMFLLSATILWGMFYSFQRDMAVGFLDELWSRNLINLFSTPLTVWEYITGLICVNLA